MGLVNNHQNAFNIQPFCSRDRAQLKSSGTKKINTEDILKKFCS